ncbi:MAG TPA: UvrD-helicase domain-containing protein, partial [Ardenticatenaceae bacterium]|nr:UvrD-helicase domain-containing protein [Ardenticatenaceae bacterium]
MSDLLQGLNPQQRLAVGTVEGPVMVLAGPGSGKTRVLTHRVAYLVREVGIDPFNILAVTFTNKAAREMAERLEKLIGPRRERLTAGTFHAICARILRRQIHHLGYENSFIIYDSDDQRRVIKQVLNELDLDDKVYKPAALHGAISRAKNEMHGPAEFAQRARSYWEEVAGRVFERYSLKLKECNAVDFDDLLVLTVRLFREAPGVLQSYRDRWHFVHVDEFQDTNVVQYEMVKLLAEKHRNVFVVGDVDQGMDGWRGADYRNIMRFADDFPQVREVVLEQNYRSTQTILDAATAVIRRNPNRKEKQLWTEKEGGPKVLVFEAYDEKEEADFIVREVRRLTARGGAALRECAVMYRTNAQSRAIEDAFVRANLPYTLVGGTRFYERREIKDLLAYLRLLHNPFDAVSMERIINVPTRGIGQKSWNDLAAWAGELGVPVYTALQLLRGTVETAGQVDESPFLPEVPVPFAGRQRTALLEFLTLLD